MPDPAVAYAHPANGTVLAYLRAGATRPAVPDPVWDLDGYELRTHPDLGEALLASAGPRAKPCEGAAYGFVVLHAEGVIFAVAKSMRHLLFRLPEAMWPRARQVGAEPVTAAGEGWMAFHAWRADVPGSQHAADLAAWCDHAFAHASALRRPR